MRKAFEQRYEISSLTRYGVDDLPSDRNFRDNIDNLDHILPAFEKQHTVVHLATDRSATASFESTLTNNLVGTYNLFEVVRISGVKGIVFSSSQHAIGGYYLDAPYNTFSLANLKKFVDRIH